MTACFKLMKALQAQGHNPSTSYCEPCVYFSRNLDPEKLEAADFALQGESCALGFVPRDEGCSDMRTSNCSARKEQTPVVE